MFTRLSPALIALSACVAPSDPTVSAPNVDSAFARAEAISTLPQTTFNNLPGGSATYVGQLGANVRGAATGSILGDMTMNVGFASNSLGGAISNINLIDADGTPNQRFDGRLQIDGVESAGTLDGFAFGGITGVDNDGDKVSSQVLLTLDGSVRDNFGRGDAVFGVANGTAEGDFFLDIDGVFFGTRP